MRMPLLYTVYISTVQLRFRTSLCVEKMQILFWHFVKNYKEMLILILSASLTSLFRMHGSSNAASTTAKGGQRRQNRGHMGCFREDAQQMYC